MFSVGDKVVFTYGRWDIVIGHISAIADGHLTVMAKNKEYRVHQTQVRKV